MEIIYGEVLSFSVEATGTGLSYQWQEDSGDGFIDILADGGGVGGYSGVTSATLEYNTPIVSQTGIKYRVRVTDTNGQEVISEPAILTVNPKEITASIVAQDKTYDGNSDAVATGSVPAGDVIEGDEVFVTVTNAAFSEANAGLRTVTADVSIANPNYSLTLGTANVDAEIYAKELTASIVAQD
uniref:YDG domain-containing protein n=1 Tax=Algoriphagus boritolerans TaxID=308111 RepID=UPI000A4F8E1B